MSTTSVGQGSGRDKNENAISAGKPKKKTFGEEGTNKVQPAPDPKAKCSGDSPLGPSRSTKSTAEPFALSRRAR